MPVGQGAHLGALAGFCNPLPMVSFGGSAVMTIMLCLGILMALERQQRTTSKLA